jgi:hypothetical protein
MAFARMAVEGIAFYDEADPPEASKSGWNTPIMGPEHGRMSVPSYFNNSAESIYGGSNERQRGIMAKLILKNLVLTAASGQSHAHQST